MSRVLLVDPSDNPVGLMEKREAHDKGLLHRAFSVFIFRKIGSSAELLIQKRASDKYHSGGLWTNTCCSHAEAGLPAAATAEKRLREEMGFACPLDFAGSFLYRADVGNGMIEHEIDHVFTAFFDPGEILPNPEEAEAVQWVEIESIKRWLGQEPKAFTAWFPKAFEIALLKRDLSPLV